MRVIPMRPASEGVLVSTAISPCPPGTDEAGYLETLDMAIGVVKQFAPRYLVVSAGMDIYEKDSLGKFKITPRGFREIGTRISELALPTVIVMEGGYNNEALGRNVLSFLASFT